jgi:hypothetical protein
MVRVVAGRQEIDQRNALPPLVWLKRHTYIGERPVVLDQGDRSNPPIQGVP